MYIIDLYSEMLSEHKKKICEGRSDICKENSLECLKFVFEKIKIFLEKHFDYPSLLDLFERSSTGRPPTLIRGSRNMKTRLKGLVLKGL